MMREAGVLLPLSALPSEYGVGEMGKFSFQFVDLLKRGKVSIWQILPLNPLGFGNSPYQPYSSLAGDEIYISLEELFKEGLLEEKPPVFYESKEYVEYESVRKYKEIFLRKAFHTFIPDQEYQTFAAQAWVGNYAVFITLKKKNNLRCWNEWSKPHKEWISTRKFDVSVYQDDIQYEIFVQYIFYKQWMKLKQYANLNGIKIMGDIPFYVGIDSLDVWANQNCFLLRRDGTPHFIAGVPPDYFSETGQRWGNPIYDWKHQEKDGFGFWLDRITYNSKLFDIIRIDHFRAFDTYWRIPAECETAVDGKWVEAPGYAVLERIQTELPDVEIIAEDLGELRKEVHELKDHFGLKGMKIVQFAFDPEEDNNDFEDIENLVIYTGTHDNQTITGWYQSQSKETQIKIREELIKLGYKGAHISEQFIRYTLDSIAITAILPLQDILGFGDEARINTPGTLGSPNWEWKLTDFKHLEQKLEFLAEAIMTSKRAKTDEYEEWKGLEEC